jgi:hypothetical protein
MRLAIQRIKQELIPINLRNIAKERFEELNNN